MRNRRRRIWIDRFQTKLLARIATYCILYQVAVWALIVIMQRGYTALEALMGEAAGFNSLVFSLVVLTALGVLFLHDALKFAHKFVGPMYRFRKTVQAVTEGAEVDLVRLRKGDMLTEFQDDLNAMLQALEERGAITIHRPAAARQGSESGAAV